MLTILFFVIALPPLIYLVAWMFLKYRFQYWERRQIPHDKPTIPSGNMQEWIRKKHFSQIFAEIYNKFKGTGPYAGFYFNTQKALVVLDTELAGKILKEDSKYFINRGFFHNEKDDPLTGNLFLLDGPKYHSLRSKLLPTFKSEVMRYIYPTVLQVSEELRKVFDMKLREANNGCVDVVYIFGRYTSDVIGTCIFGENCNSLRNPNLNFYVMARKFFSQRRHPAYLDSLINCFPEWAKFFRFKIIPEDVSNFYMGMVKDTIRWRKAKNIRKNDYLDVLMDLNNQARAHGEESLSLEELAAQAFAFFITAFDTCSATMSYTLYELAHNPHIQNRLRREIVSTLQLHRQILSYDCLQNMRYLDQVVAESLRKYPVSPALFRKCTKRYVPADAHYYIDKGCTVIIPVLSFQHDPMHFPDPFRFDPERFSNFDNINTYSYLPFGHGTRSCIGMRFGRIHTKLGLIQLIKNYKFNTCEQTKTPIQIVIPSFNLHPLDITLKVTKV